MERLPSLLSWACAQGAGTLDLIRPKPVSGNQRWDEENALSASDGARLGVVLREQQPLFTRTTLTGCRTKSLSPLVYRVFVFEYV